MQTKYIFITGGVVSGLGKGIAAASIAALLESRGMTVSLMKLDPYINVDAGTMNPYQHGEVFVTEDGAETDLDLGHYERYTNTVLGRKHNCTTGQIYDAILRKERAGKYLGATVQVVPHVIDEIKLRILDASQGADISIVEIGGTVGDIESLPFLESIRQFRHDHGRKNCLFLHLTLIIETTEMKTKPTQHSVGKLREIGIQPDLLLCRTHQPLSESIKRKIALFTNVEANSVFEGLEADSVYKIPLMFHRQGMDARIVEGLQMWTRAPKLQIWKDLIDHMEHPEDEVDIAFVGKYVAQKDTYESLNEALIHGGLGKKLKVNLHYINSENLENLSDKELDSQLQFMHGILVAPGFGERGVEGKIAAVTYARVHNIPFFGICLGMQMAVIEFARNMAGLPEAHSGEFRPNHTCNIIDLMPEQEGCEETGGTMRLGGCDAHLQRDSRIASVYQTSDIVERHRHRYEVMNQFVPQLESAGLVFSGHHTQRNLVETIELPDHPWFIGCQFHPELKSKPFKPHPLFLSFIEAAYMYKQKQSN